MQFTQEEQLVRTQTVMALLGSWNVSSYDQLNLLGLPSKVKARHLSRYQQDEMLPQIDDVNARIDHLLGIADALRTSYPHNELMGPMWLRTQHRRFENQSPLSIMLNQGLSGLIRVRSHLDCSFDWQQDIKK